MRVKTIGAAGLNCISEYSHGGKMNEVPAPETNVPAQKNGGDDVYRLHLTVTPNTFGMNM